MKRQLHWTVHRPRACSSNFWLLWVLLHLWHHKLTHWHCFFCFVSDDPSRKSEKKGRLCIVENASYNIVKKGSSKWLSCKFFCNVQPCWWCTISVFLLPRQWLYERLLDLPSDRFEFYFKVELWSQYSSNPFSLRASCSRYLDTRFSLHAACSRYLLHQI